MTTQKLFIIVRADLTPGAQCAQSCHALRAFTEAHPELDAAWYRESNNLVVLNVADEDALLELARRMTEAGDPCAEFREPDFADQLTAIATMPNSGRVLAKLPLALRAA